MADKLSPDNQVNFPDAELKAYQKIFGSFGLYGPDENETKVLVRTEDPPGVPMRLCIPRQLVAQIILDAHLYLSHLASDKTLGFLSAMVWFPCMWTQVKEILIACRVVYKG